MSERSGESIDDAEPETCLPCPDTLRTSAATDSVLRARCGASRHTPPPLKRRFLEKVWWGCLPIIG